MITQHLVLISPSVALKFCCLNFRTLFFCFWPWPSASKSFRTAGERFQSDLERNCVAALSSTELKDFWCGTRGARPHWESPFGCFCVPLDHVRSTDELLKTVLFGRLRPTFSNDDFDAIPNGRHVFRVPHPNAPRTSVRSASQRICEFGNKLERKLRPSSGDPEQKVKNTVGK